MKSVANFINKKQIVFLGIIFFIGLFLRLYNLKNTRWFTDTGRDILVAKHLVEYSGNKFIFPLGNGGNILKNSPIYYWIIASFWFIYPSEIGVISIFAFIGSLNVILAYILSKEIFKKEYVLILPFFVSISDLLIYQSRFLFQPNLIPFFQLISFIFLFKGLKRKSFYLWAFQFSFLAALIHYSYLPILMVLFVFICVDSYLSKSYVLFKKLFVLCVIDIFLFYFLTKSPLIFFKQQFVYSFKNLYNNLFVNLIQLSNLFIRNNNIFIIILFYFSFLISLIYLFKKREKKSLLLVILFSSLIITSTYKIGGYYNSTHPYYLIILIIYSYIISKIKKFHIFLSIFFVFLLSVTISQNTKNILVNSKYELEGSRKIVKEIINNTKDLSKVVIAKCFSNDKDSECPTCFLGGVWFHLEEASRKKMGIITNNVVFNYTPYSYNSPAKYTYLISDYEINECLKDLKVNDKRAIEISSNDGWFLYILEDYVF